MKQRVKNAAKQLVKQLPPTRRLLQERDSLALRGAAAFAPKRLKDRLPDRVKGKLWSRM